MDGTRPSVDSLLTPANISRKPTSALPGDRDVLCLDVAFLPSANLLARVVVSTLLGDLAHHNLATGEMGLGLWIGLIPLSIALGSAGPQWPATDNGIMTSMQPVPFTVSSLFTVSSWCNTVSSWCKTPAASWAMRVAPAAASMMKPMEVEDSMAQRDCSPQLESDRQLSERYEQNG